VGVQATSASATLVSALAIAFTVPLVASAAASAKAPTLGLTAVSVQRTAAAGKYPASVRLRLRWCASIGPRAAIVVREFRRAGATTRARAAWAEPLGVDLDRVGPYECVAGYLLAWVVERRLVAGPGAYGASLRIRDGQGRLSKPVSLGFRLGG
jgi:hypothetical protein